MVIGSKLPDIPDPTKIASSGAEIAKAVGQGVTAVGVDVVAGVEQILFNTIERSIGALASGAKEVASIAKTNIDTGKTTADSVRRDIDQACNSVLSQVDRTVGGEIVRKFKSEVEKQLRQF